MASENRYWGQRRIQAELVRLGFKVCARTVAKYMRGPYAGRPSPSWREFLKRHARDIWACDFFCVQTIWFRTFYVFFAIRHANREVLHVWVGSIISTIWPHDHPDEHFAPYSLLSTTSATKSARLGPIVAAKTIGHLQIEEKPLCVILSTTSRNAFKSRPCGL
jgi:hypothetical protein